MGHWCEVYPALFDTAGRTWHLIAYSVRDDGAKVINYHAEVYWDEDGAPYVADPEFIELTSLGSLRRGIRHGPNDTGCLAPDAQSPDTGRTLVAGKRCFERGVYLTDVALREKTAGAVP